MARTIPPAMDAPRLTIAQIGPDARGRGGMAAVQDAVLRSSLADRHDLVAITTHRPGSAAGRLLVFAGALARIAAWALGRGPRVAHVHVTVRGSMYRKAVVVALVRLARRPVVLHVHAGAPELETFHRRLGPLRRRTLGRAFRAADRVLAVSSASAERVRALYGAREVDLVLNPAPAVPAGTNGSGAAADAPRLLYVGGFANPVKGGTVLLDALDLLRAEHPDLRATLAGPGELPARARDLVAGGTVEWRGWLDERDKREALAHAPIVVLPSVSEGLPMALLEAMAHGRAVITTRVGGMPDVIEHGREGLLVAPGDARALADSIRMLLTDRDRVEALGAAARARAAELSTEALADRLERMYREIAGS